MRTSDVPRALKLKLGETFKQYNLQIKFNVRNVENVRHPKMKAMFKANITGQFAVLSLLQDNINPILKKESIS